MTQVTMDVDEKANGQTIYSPELDKYLEIYIIDQVVIQAKKNEAQGKLAAAQEELENLHTIELTKDNVVDIKPSPPITIEPEIPPAPTSTPPSI